MKPGSASHLDLVSDPEKILIPEEDTSLPWSAIAVVALGFGMAAGLALFTSTNDASKDSSQAILDGSALMLEQLTQQREQLVASHVRVIADDARIRTTLATPGMDAATIEDLMKDFQKASGLSVVGLLDAKGIVRAVIGSDPLRGVDLSSSSLFSQRSEVAPSRLWTFKGELMVVALAAVRLGYEEFFILGASNVRAEFLEPLTGAFGASAGILLDGSVQHRVTSGPLDDRAINGASKLADTEHTITIDGHVFAVHRQTMGNVQPPASVVWVRPAEAAGTGGAQRIVWLSALLVLVTSALASFLTWRAR